MNSLDQRTEKLQARVANSLRKRIEALAYAHGQPVSEEIRAALIAHVEGRVLSCAVCYYTREDGVSIPAVTVVDGYAVCDEHRTIMDQTVRMAEILDAANPL